jgi:hypothetical protein
MPNFFWPGSITKAISQGVDQLQIIWRLQRLYFGVSSTAAALNKLGLELKTLASAVISPPAPNQSSVWRGRVCKMLTDQTEHVAIK